MRNLKFKRSKSSVAEPVEVVTDYFEQVKQKIERRLAVAEANLEIKNAERLAKMRQQLGIPEPVEEPEPPLKVDSEVVNIERNK